MSTTKWIDALRRRLDEYRKRTASAPSMADRRALLAGLLAAPFAASGQNMEEQAALPAEIGGADALSGQPEVPEVDLDGLSGATTRKWIEEKLEPLKGTLPKGKIGNLEMSRLIFGSNLIGGYAHARDLIYMPRLFREYNTEGKVFETLFIAEQAGIDTMITPSHELPLIAKYYEAAGGAIQTMVQVYEKGGSFIPDIDKAIDNGATTLYLQGAHADRLVENGQMDVIHDAIQHIQDRHYLAGIGGHSVETPKKCEEAGINADYYVKTCHHDRYWSAHPRENRVEFSVIKGGRRDHNEYHDNIFDLFPEETVAFMETVKKPWVAFKVLAGGAIHPRDGFRYAFENGADFICVGIFDFQIIEDVNITLRVLDNLGERKRPWYA